MTEKDSGAFHLPESCTGNMMLFGSPNQTTNISVGWLGQRTGDLRNVHLQQYMHSEPEVSHKNV